MAIRLYNTLTRKKEEFKPVNPPQVTFYVCGPTVYDFIHIGNARVFIVFDVIRRYLQYRGYRVTMVQNYTDIDDKMINRAREQGITVPELAQRFIEAYREDAAALRVRPADVQPRATEHIEQIIALIKKLEERGYAYASEGDVYFDTGRFEPYGQLSQQKQEELLAGARVEPGEKKKHPLDFALWKQMKPGEPSWESPWGAGRPGWHIECSAMSMHYLGLPLDIHAGGTDLIFPHHENEIAQSQAAYDRPLANYWLHAGYLNIEQQKMSKSLGNVLPVRHLLEEYDPLDLRFFLLSAHYRKPLNFSRELIRQARSGRERLQEFLENLQDALEKGEGGGEPGRLGAALEKARERFLQAMDDDFNTADGIAALFELAREGNSYLKENYPYDAGLLEDVLSFYREVNEILEIVALDTREALAEEIREAIRQREEARRRKDWATADRIREELLEKGIILEDTPHGVRWKRRS